VKSDRKVGLTTKTIANYLAGKNFPLTKLYQPARVPETQFDHKC
jgi:hypothetical protein